MSRPVIIKKLKEKNPKLTQPEIELIIATFCEVVEKALINRKSIEIRGFGTFSKKFIRPRKFVNPKTKKVSYLGETSTMHFKPSKFLIKK